MRIADDWLIIVPLLLSIALIGPSHRRQYRTMLSSLETDNPSDVKMWHVGIHVWQVPWNEQEPNYDEYYAVRTRKPSISYILTRKG